MKRTVAPVVIVSAGLLFCLVAQSVAAPKTPTFLARQDYANLLSSWIQVADTNGDGIPDIIAAQTGWTVLLGNGNGTFRHGPSGHSGMTAGAAPIAADLNGDGVIDLVYAGGLNGTGTPQGISVCLGNGDGTFQPGVFYQAGSDTEIDYVVLGAFNGDQKLDAVVAGASGIWLFTGKGDGTFNSAVLAVSLPASAGALATADFNRDGHLDLVVTMPMYGGNGFAVLLGNGDGTFQAPIMFSQPLQAHAVAAGVLTKGGYPGIVVPASGTSTVAVYDGNGAGGFSGPRRVYLPGASTVAGVAIGDVNGDGIPDLVSAQGYIALGTVSGRFQKPLYYPVNNLPGFGNVILADLRNKGLTDIVTGAYGAVSVLLSLGKGKYEDGVWTKVSGGAGCGAVADYNRDGKPDLAVNTPSGITILLGTGKAGSPFTTGTTISLANAGCLVTGDLNGDGIPDLLVPSNGTVLAYLGKGDGTFTLKSTTATPSGGYVVVGDFNHDGKLDFATSGNLLARGNGDGTFRTPAAIVASPPWSGFSGIAVGDINKDGWPDLVLTNTGIPYNNVFVMLNNRHSGFTQVPTTFGALTTQPILADLNGDGNLDLILSYIGYIGDGQGAAIYLGNGRGTFTYSQTLSGPFGPVYFFNMIADVNGDGILDVLVLGNDTLAVYVGEGEAAYASPFFIGTGPSPGDLVTANLHGQPASAGLPDLVAPDTSGGVMTLINKTR